MANHVALVVEDDPHIAAALTELLASLGARGGARGDAGRGGAGDRGRGYCYALLDTQIPANAEARALVSAGETALGPLGAMVRRAASGRPSGGGQR